MTINQPGLKFGPVLLEPGVRYSHAWAFMYASLITIGMVVFVNIGQQYVLNVMLEIDPREIGSFTGRLSLVTEIVIMASVAFFGILSDRVGRRAVYAFGLIVLGLSYLLFPLSQTTNDMYMYRIVYALGAAAATGMLGTVTNDYPQDNYRGKMIGLSGVLIAVGAILVNGIGRQVPNALIEGGMDPIDAARYLHWTITGVCLFSAGILFMFLQPGTPVKKEDRASFGELFAVGFKAARNPRIALAYGSAFVARSDLVIIGAFTIAWGAFGAQQAGLPVEAGIGRGALLFIVAQLAGLIWAPIMGILLDRVNRVAGMAFGGLMGAIAFVSLIFVGDIFDNRYLPLFAFLGIGQISCFFASQALIGQEAPMRERGAVIGAFGFSGAVGILFFTGIGGELFSLWRPAGPFIFVGAASFLIFLFAVLVRIKAPGKMLNESSKAQSNRGDGEYAGNRQGAGPGVPEAGT